MTRRDWIDAVLMLPAAIVVVLGLWAGLGLIFAIAGEPPR